MDENKNEQNQTESQDLSLELNQAKERYMYLQAEFDNFKKRVEKERASWIDSAQDIVIIDLLSTVDDAERALHEVQNVPHELQVHVAGFEMTVKSLHKLLKKYDIEEIPFSKNFNPEYFEAVMQIESSASNSGDIVSILQKGYVHKGHVSTSC